MLPKERRSNGQNDLFRSRLDQIVDMMHPLAKLGGHVDWMFLEKTFARLNAMDRASRLCRRG